MISWLLTPRRKVISAAALGLAAGVWERCAAQPATFAGDAQHRGVYDAPAQHLNLVRWSTVIDPYTSGSSAHYGAPVISPSNTVFVSITTPNGFKVNAVDGATGRLKYSLSTDYIPPIASSWKAAYQPVIAAPASGLRLYYPGAGGTTYYITNIDSDTPSAPVQECCYGDLVTYDGNTNGFNSTVFINTPITASADGVIFFGFRVQGSAPAPLNSTNSGFGRIDPDGNGLYVLAGPASGDTRISRDSHNCAPALSNDGSTLYVAVKATNDAYGYLLGLDSSTLSTKYKVSLRVPPGTNGAYATISDDATSSPTVGPDGDVFFGIIPGGSPGYLLHFSADLRTQKAPSRFGWDHTVSIVSPGLVPSYHGSSSYLLFTKYNYYGGADPDRIAVLDPNSTQLDQHYHYGPGGLVEMREVLTAIGCTPLSSSGYYVREWCINAGAVNPATASVFAPSEDGRLYRWDLNANSFTETIRLGPQVGDPYVPAVVGPDGTIFALSGNRLFAVTSASDVAVGVYSSAPDMNSFVFGQVVTFTAVVTNRNPSQPAPTGTVTFKDLTYQGLTALTSTLASNVALVDGRATITNSTLIADSNYLGNHFITASYSGDAIFSASSATLVQKVHASATFLSLASSLPDSNNGVTLSAAVTPVTGGFGTPSGQVMFLDGSNFVAQVPLSNGVASVRATNVLGSAHIISAIYASDTYYASSSGTLRPTPPRLTGSIIASSRAFQLSFSNLSGSSFRTLGATALDLPLIDWTVLGTASEILPGKFQFTDTDATNHVLRFYRVQSP